MSYKFLALGVLWLFPSLAGYANQPGWGCIGEAAYCQESSFNDTIKEALISFGSASFSIGGRPATAKLQTLVFRLDKAMARLSLDGDGVGPGASLILEYDAASQARVALNGQPTGLRSLSTPTFTGVTGGVDLSAELTARLGRRLQRTFERAAERMLGDTPNTATVAPVIARLLDGKTLVGEDGVRQEFGPFDYENASITTKVTLADGSISEFLNQLIDTPYAKKVLLVEKSAGGEDWFGDISLGDDGSFTATPIHAEDSNFVARTCRTTAAGKTDCVKTIQENGVERQIIYREAA